MNEKDKIIRFLKDNPVIFIDAVSCGFPLSDKLIERFQDLLDWEFLTINNSRGINFEFCKKYRNRLYWKLFNPWMLAEECMEAVQPELVSLKFLEEFKNELNWSNLSLYGSGELLTDENIERFNNRIDFKNLSFNDKKVFTGELVQRYEDKWDWQGLSGRHDLPWSTAFIRKYQDKWDWDFIEDNMEIHWSEDMFTIAKKYLSREVIEELRYECMGNIEDEDDEEINFYDPLGLNDSSREVYTTEEFAGILNNFNPAQQSLNIRIPWSISLIEYYKDEWDWNALSVNESLPWSEELIDKYSDRWHWGDKLNFEQIEEDEGEIMVIKTGLSTNKAIPWTTPMIRKYRNKLVWLFFVHNGKIEWSIELLREFHSWMSMTKICHIRNLWEKIFIPNLDEETISGIFDEKRQEISEIIRKRKGELANSLYLDFHD